MALLYYFETKAKIVMEKTESFGEKCAFLKRYGIEGANEGLKYPKGIMESKEYNCRN